MENIKQQKPKRQYYEDRLHKLIHRAMQCIVSEKPYSDHIQMYSYIPSGEKRDCITGSLIKDKGLLRGIPYYIVWFSYNKATYILYIECKVSPNKLSDEQKEFANNMQDNEFFYTLSMEKHDIDILLVKFRIKQILDNTIRKIIKI